MKKRTQPSSLLAAVACRVKRIAGLRPPVGILGAAFSVLIMLIAGPSLLPCTEPAVPPAVGDDTPGPLLAYQQQWLAPYSGDYRQLPLARKAEFFEWQLWRYHLTELEQVANRVILSEAVGVRPLDIPGSDTATWNGALLAALAYKLAVANDPATLARIETLLRGLHRYQESSGRAGLLARSMCLATNPRGAEMVPGTLVDGREVRLRVDPAKGTYNQVVAGYATLLMLAEERLSADSRRGVRNDLAALILNVLENEYRITAADGHRTTYGDLTPILAGVGVPFNAQVAYLLVAAGHTFPPDDPAARSRIDEGFAHIRHRHHAYYAEPWRSLVQPQRVAASPFIKGMNDRMHVHTAAFVGLRLEEFTARRDGRDVEREFQHQLGQSMFWAIETIGHERNSLAALMWAAIATDEATYEAIVEHRRHTVRRKMEQALVDAVEQLRRFPLNRFIYEGRERESSEPQWADAYRPDDFRWKVNPRAVWEITGPATGELYCAIDYLYAYWLMRHFRLDEHPRVREAFAESGVLEK